jgi:archaellum component FlaC
MAVREIAKELYKVTQKIEGLKKQIAQASEDEKIKIKLEMELKQLEEEKTTLQKKLNDLKGKPLPI